jgi:hypothetical protein
MNTALWVIASILAAALLIGGLAKLILSRNAITAAGFGVLEDFSTATVKIIGTLEVLAATGLILPAALGIAPILVPLAAVGVVLLISAAIIAHLRRGETRVVVANLAVIALAAFVAWGRFGPHSFTG